MLKNNKLKMEKRITITFSKIFASVIVVMSFILAIYLKDISVFITTTTLSSGIVVNKQIQDRIKNNKEI
jgi:hypothetical protein